MLHLQALESRKRSISLKRAVAIVLLGLSTLLIWVASSPTSLQAFVLPSRTTVHQTSAAAVSAIATRPKPIPSQKQDGALPPPVALLLQGIVFLACGILWPKKSATAPGGQPSRVPVPSSNACRIETVGAD